MTFFTADLCDQYNDRVALLGPGYRNYGGADKFEGEIVTMKLDRANTDLVSLLRDVDGSGKVVVVDSDQAYFAIVGEMLMKFSEQNHYAGRASRSCYFAVTPFCHCYCTTSWQQPVSFL